MAFYENRHHSEILQMEIDFTYIFNQIFYKFLDAKVCNFVLNFHLPKYTLRSVWYVSIYIIWIPPRKKFFFILFGFFGSFSLSISVSVSVCVYRDCCTAQPNTGAQTQSNETVYALHAMNILFASSLFFTTHNIRSAYCSMYNIILVFTFYVFSLCMRCYYYCCCCRRCCCVYAFFSLLCFVMFPHFPSRFPLLIYSVLFTVRFK